jgi:hypothetical protein
MTATVLALIALVGVAVLAWLTAWLAREVNATLRLIISRIDALRDAAPDPHGLRDKWGGRYHGN